MTTLRIALVGGTGKKTFLHRLCTNDFSQNASASSGSVVWKTNKGFVRFDITVYPTRAFVPECFEQDGVVIFHDNLFSSPTTLRDREWNSLPQVRVWSRCDEIVEARNFRKNARKFALSTPFYGISAKSNYNYEKPLLEIMRQVLGSDTNLAES